MLSTVAEGTTGNTLTELARAVDLSPSTASRLLGTLAQHGFVRRDENSRYGVGPRMKQIAAATLREEPLYDLVGPHLLSLAAETGETANLGVATQDGRVLYLRQVSSGQLVQTATWTGRTIPLESTALGRALSGEASTDGYVTSHRDDSDIVAVSSPIVNHDGEIVGAISVNAPDYRTTDSSIRSFGRALMSHAHEISLALGAPADFFTHSEDTEGDEPDAG
ncbi:MAG: IclR family transcriptional regulator [Actinobacteria bacterium]|nr:IclR family transcriptional regulator [Actinomycetota bacterium]